MLLFYVRHGDPIYNPDSLTELGEKQAEALCERFKVNGLDKMFSSSSNRAILTATPTAKMLDKEIEILDWCNEGYAWNEFSMEYEGCRTWLYNHYKLLPTLCSKEMYEMRYDWVNHPIFADTKVKEGTKRVNENVDNLLCQLGFRHDREKGVYFVEKKNSDRVALFAHEGFGAIFLSSLLDIPYPAFVVHFNMTHTGVTAIHFDETREYCVPKILTYSNDAHILKADLPLKFSNGINL